MTDRVRLLREIVAEAERSVRFIGDPLLRLAAFEKNLDTLLDERLKTRRSRKKSSSKS